MDRFRRLTNEGVFVEKEFIFNGMLEALQKSRDESMEDMLERVAAFAQQVGDKLAEKLEFEDEAQKDVFKMLRSGDGASLGRIMMNEYGPLTPDKVRAYFLMYIVPRFIQDALKPFDEVARDEARHAVLPFIAGLFDAATKAARSIRDTKLRREVKDELEKNRTARIEARIQSGVVSIH